MAKTKRLAVKFGQLTKPLSKKNVAVGTTIAQFCTDNGLTFGSSVRVNAESVNKNYELQENDIVTAIEDVNGG